MWFSPGPRPASPGLARPSPSPLLALAHPRFKQSSRQNGQKRNLLPFGCVFSFCLLTIEVFFRGSANREEHSMDQCRSRLKLSENFERHWSILISGGISYGPIIGPYLFLGNSYGPMVLKVLLKFPPKLVLVHGWLFPVLMVVSKRWFEFSGEQNSATGYPLFTSI